MLAADIAAYLAAEGLGIFDTGGVTGDIFIGQLPPSPDDCIMIRPTGGYQSDGKSPYDNPTVQILVRGIDQEDTFDLAQSVYDKLHGFHHQSLVAGSPYVLNCLGVQSGPNYLGTDKNNRYEFSLNFELEIKNDGRLI